MFNTATAETEHMEADLDELGESFKTVYEKINKKVCLKLFKLF